MVTITPIVPALIDNFPDQPDRAVISAQEWNQRFDLLTEQGNRSQNTLGEVVDTTNLHLTDYENPHTVTKTQLGLGNVDNTSDADKPISDATQVILDTKVDKEPGKTLVEVVQIGGTSTEAVMSQKAIADYIGYLGGGDMLKAVYDPDDLGVEAFTMKADFEQYQLDTALALTGLQTALETIDVSAAITTDTYAGLDTTDKTVQGAINEVKGSLDTLSQDTIILDSTPASDVNANGLKVELTAGESLVFGNICRMNSSGKMVKALNTGIATGSAIAVCLETTASNASGDFLLHGIIRNDAWTLAPGSVYYLNSTGTITVTAPTAANSVVQILGVALSATTLYFYPQLVQVELA